MPDKRKQRAARTPTSKCGGFSRDSQMRGGGKNALPHCNSKGLNGLRQKKFVEEILAVCRHAGNGVFPGKIGTNGRPAEFAQAAESGAHCCQLSASTDQ
jgi:hypothetical protein